jgi:YidC/Oxa1 family membrane protein insertase
MMYIVPFFSLTGLYWQFGLVLYWVTTNLWTLGQQFFMFRNWTTETPQAAGATAPAASGSAKAAPGTAKAAPGTAKAAPRPAAGNGRPASGAPRAKTGSGAGGTATTAGRVRTGSAARDAAANASGPPNGQNGAAKRGLLRLGRHKEEEAAPEPEVPATKVVRQQPVRQARSKRSGKR